jgi:hypothetical protein
MTPEQKARWEAAYTTENEAFRKANLTGDALTRWNYQRYIANYLRCVAGVDRTIGRVLEYLDKTGLARNTIVVYSSDQGFFLGEHGWFDKRWMYEESLRMPLVIRWPVCGSGHGRRQPRAKPRLRSDVPGGRRRGCGLRHAGQKPRAAPAWRQPGRLASERLLPLLRIP